MNVQIHLPPCRHHGVTLVRAFEVNAGRKKGREDDQVIQV